MPTDVWVCQLPGVRVCVFPSTGWKNPAVVPAGVRAVIWKPWVVVRLLKNPTVTGTCSPGCQWLGSRTWKLADPVFRG
jgi:hypothetical protein